MRMPYCHILVWRLFQIHHLRRCLHQVCSRFEYTSIIETGEASWWKRVFCVCTQITITYFHPTRSSGVSKSYNVSLAQCFFILNAYNGTVHKTQSRVADYKRLFYYWRQLRQSLLLAYTWCCIFLTKCSNRIYFTKLYLYMAFRIHAFRWT